ncbi:MAG: hypothetical protein ACTSXP_09970 [Promethearchaeota archaeon]
MMNPDTWDCQFEFQNLSEFKMKLQKFKFIFGDENTKSEIVEQTPDVVVLPKSSWTSEPWDLIPKDEPTCSEMIEYTVMATVQKRVDVEAELETVDLRVLALEGAKQFDTVSVPSFRKSVINVTIDVKTKGKAPFDLIRMEHTIPRHFRNPEKPEMKIIIEEKEIPADDFNFTFEPDTEDTEIDRKMKIEIKDVMENIGELDDETSIVVKYPLTAIKPKKDETYSTPVLFQAYIDPEGSPVEAYIEPEPLVVIHERRRTRIGKSIFPAEEDKTFEINIIYQNKGDAVKTDVKISDFVPAAFNVMESEPEHEETKATNGKLLTWIIPEIQP